MTKRELQIDDDLGRRLAEYPGPPIDLAMRSPDGKINKRRDDLAREIVMLWLQWLVGHGGQRWSDPRVSQMPQGFELNEHQDGSGDAIRFDVEKRDDGHWMVEYQDAPPA